MNETQKAKLKWLRGEIQKGLDDLEVGNVRDGSVVMAEFREKLFNLKAQQEKKNESVREG